MNQAQRDSIFEWARRDLCVYGMLQNSQWRPARVHRLIARKLEDLEAGKIKRLMIHMPPQNGKTTLASCFFPAWFAGRNVGQSIAFASYGAERAEDVGMKIRELLLNPIHAKIFGRDTLVAGSASRRRLSFYGGGSFYAVGVGTALTGRPAHLMVVDDPVKDREEADSPTMRRRAGEWWRSTARTRLQSNYRALMIQTRWNQDDLSGQILEKEKWEVLSLPALAEENDALGRELGEPLWPERFPLEWLLEQRSAIGEREWLSLYEQRPTPLEGNIIRREWLRYYKTIPTDFVEVLMSVDASFKNRADSDYVAIGVWGRVGPRAYLLDQIRARLDFPATLGAIRSLAEKWPMVDLKLIEDAANGPAIVSVLQNELTGIVPVKVEKSKTARLNSCAPFFEAGNVWLPDTSIAPWIGEYVEELVGFPGTKNDDQVDQTSQGLYRLLHGGVGGANVFSFYEREAAAIRDSTNAVNSEAVKAIDIFGH